MTRSRESLGREGRISWSWYNNAKQPAFTFSNSRKQTKGRHAHVQSRHQLHSDSVLQSFSSPYISHLSGKGAPIPFRPRTCKHTNPAAAVGCHCEKEPKRKRQKLKLTISPTFFSASIHGTTLPSPREKPCIRSENSWQTFE